MSACCLPDSCACLLFYEPTFCCRSRAADSLETASATIVSSCTPAPCSIPASQPSLAVPQASQPPSAGPHAVLPSDSLSETLLATLPASTSLAIIASPCTQGPYSKLNPRVRAGVATTPIQPAIACSAFTLSAPAVGVCASVPCVSGSTRGEATRRCCRCRGEVLISPQNGTYFPHCISVYSRVLGCISTNTRPCFRTCIRGCISVY